MWVRVRELVSRTGILGAGIPSSKERTKVSLDGEKAHEHAQAHSLSNPISGFLDSPGGGGYSGERRKRSRSSRTRRGQVGEEVEEEEDSEESTVPR